MKLIVKKSRETGLPMHSLVTITGNIGSGKSTVAEHACKYLEERDIHDKVIRVRVDEKRPIEHAFLEEMSLCEELGAVIPPLGSSTDREKIKRILQNIQKHVKQRNVYRNFIFLFHNTSKLHADCQQSLVLEKLVVFIETLYDVFGDGTRFVVTTPESLPPMPSRFSETTLPIDRLDDELIVVPLFHRLLSEKCSYSCNRQFQCAVRNFVGDMHDCYRSMEGNPMLVQSVVEKFEKKLHQRSLEMKDVIFETRQGVLDQ